ncbi:MAG: hypothetical protein VB062_09365 [Christensenella sp.]|nr:hypothetical protein [Christensenella sp.]
MNHTLQRKAILRAMAALFALALLLPLGRAAYAADADKINLLGTNVSGDVLQVVFYTDAEEAPSLETLSLSVAGRQVALESVTPLSYADPGTSYVFLFDTNTAVTERALPDMQALAKGIVDQMGAEDNALVLPIGQAMDQAQFRSDHKTLEAAIGALAYGGGGADLYSSISDAVSLCESGEGVRARTCVVVMADGLDSAVSGISLTELSEQVATSHVPVHVVALTYNTKTPERIDAAKNITGIARRSPGGLDILLKNDGTSVGDAVNQILSQRDKTYLAVVKSENIRAAASGDSAEITLTQKTKTGELTAAREFSLAALPQLAAAPTPGVEANTAQEQAQATPLPAATEGPQKQEAVTIPLWALIAGGCALIAIGVIAIVIAAAVNRKKQKKESDSFVRFSQDASARPANPAPHSAGKANTARAASAGVCIVRLGEREEIVFEGDLSEPLPLGKGEGVSPALAKDAADGDVFCRLICRDGMVWATQMREGALVNGVSARINTRLMPGDVLRIADVDYRVFFSVD